MRRAFKAAVSDLAWTPDGLTLLAASLDGTIASVSFTNAELGTTLTHAKVPRHFLRFSTCARDCLPQQSYRILLAST